MNAKIIFENILQQVETSDLNFAVSRTPFSATISLKCSFIKKYEKAAPETVKHHENCDTVSVEPTKMNEPKPSDKLESDVKVLESTIKTLETTINDQKNLLNAKSKQIKDSSKHADDHVAELREELLKVKQERAKFRTNVKTLEEELLMLKGETENVKHENGKMIKALKAHETEVEKLKQDRVSLEQELVKKIPQFKCDSCEQSTMSLSDLKKHVQAQHHENKSSQIEVECSECSFRLPSYKILKEHKRSEHCRNKATQNDEISLFEEYPCFYCDEMICSDSDLGKHTISCYGCIRLTEQVEFPCKFCETNCISILELEQHMTVYHYEWDLTDEPSFEYEFPCDVCDTNCVTKVELEQHMTDYHYNFYTKADLKSCDFCSLKFGTLGGLRSHIRSLHKEMLPT